MKCPSCGLDAPDSANFCNHCGSPLSIQGVVTGGGAPTKPGDDIAANYIMGSLPDQGKEVDIWAENPSMRTVIPGAVSWILGGIAVIIMLQVIPGKPGGTLEWIIIGAVVLIVLFMLAKYYIRLHSIHYRLTSQRIFITHGLVNKRTDEVELEKYKDVFVNQDFWDKIVGCGDIEVVTGDLTNPTIKIIDVIDPVGKKESIRSAARERKSGLGITRREEL